MSNREKVDAIIEAWSEIPVVKRFDDAGKLDLALFAQVAINVLADWGKRPSPLVVVKTERGKAGLMSAEQRVAEILMICCPHGECPHAHSEWAAALAKRIIEAVAP